MKKANAPRENRHAIAQNGTLNCLRDQVDEVIPELGKLPKQFNAAAVLDSQQRRGIYGHALDRRRLAHHDRDATTLPLIRRAIDRGVPLLAICRGIQELNVALGGTLFAEVQEIEGRLDHRAPVSDNQDERFAIRQSVSIKEGSCLAGIFGAGTVPVNSVHRQAVDRVGAKLVVEAVAEDGTVEAVSVKDAKAFAVGVQWHPEYWAKSDDASARIFRAFGDAVRAHVNGPH